MLATTPDVSHSPSSCSREICSALSLPTRDTCFWSFLHCICQSWGLIEHLQKQTYFIFLCFSQTFCSSSALFLMSSSLNTFSMSPATITRSLPSQFKITFWFCLLRLASLWNASCDLLNSWTFFSRDQFSFPLLNLLFKLVIFPLQVLDFLSIVRRTWN